MWQENADGVEIEEVQPLEIAESAPGELAAASTAEEAAPAVGQKIRASKTFKDSSYWRLYVTKHDENPDFYQLADKLDKRKEDVQAIWDAVQGLVTRFIGRPRAERFFGQLYALYGHTEKEPVKLALKLWCSTEYERSQQRALYSFINQCIREDEDAGRLREDPMPALNHAMVHPDL